MDKPADIIAAVKAGRGGAWLDDAGLKRCLSLDVENPNLKKQNDLLKQEKDLALDESAKCAAALSLDHNENKILREQEAAKDQLVNNLTADLNAWYRNPIIIGVLGVAVGAAGTALVFVHGLGR